MLRLFFLVLIWFVIRGGRTQTPEKDRGGEDAGTRGVGPPVKGGES